MLSTRIFEKKIAPFPSEVQNIALEIRNLVAEVASQATEEVHSRGFSYYFKDRGGPVSAGICQIKLTQDHVQLAFIHGAFLDDPRHLLSGKAKAKRYLEISSFSNTDWDYLKQLILEHSNLDPYSIVF